MTARSRCPPFRRRVLSAKAHGYTAASLACSTCRLDILSSFPAFPPFAQIVWQMFLFRPTPVLALPLLPLPLQISVLLALRTSGRRWLRHMQWKWDRSEWPIPDMATMRRSGFCVLPFFLPPPSLPRQPVGSTSRPIDTISSVQSWAGWLAALLRQALWIARVFQQINKSCNLSSWCVLVLSSPKAPRVQWNSMITCRARALVATTIHELARSR